jgi:intracellular septation protein A
MKVINDLGHCSTKIRKQKKQFNVLNALKIIILQIMISKLDKEIVLSSEEIIVKESYNLVTDEDLYKKFKECVDSMIESMVCIEALTLEKNNLLTQLSLLI